MPSSLPLDLTDAERRTLSEARVIYVMKDNWPVHYHADIIGKLEPQQWP